MGAKILIYDIECTGHLGYSYSVWDDRMHKILEYPIMLSFSYAWYQEGKKPKIKCVTLMDFKSFKKNPKNDYYIAQELWKLFDEADFTLGHNSYSFDDSMARMFFMKHKMKPTSPYRSIDTKKMAKAVGRFGSNSLQYLSTFFGHEGKEKVSHADLWWDCLLGDKKAWRLMRIYNDKDVKETIAIYEDLRPWWNKHPNLSVYKDGTGCPKCDSKEFQYRGYSYTNTTKYRRARCNKCHSWFRERTQDRESQNRPTLL
jgi:hypothetical protein